MSDDNSVLMGGVAPENARLDSFFPTGDRVWEGRIMAGAFGPDSPEMATKGGLKGETICDGQWRSCDMEVVTESIVWRGRLIVGWNSGSSQYDALLVDSIGMFIPLAGGMNGDEFTLVAENFSAIGGIKARPRFTWRLRDDGGIDFINEHQIEGQDWSLWEEELIKPAA